MMNENQQEVQQNPEIEAQEETLGKKKKHPSHLETELENCKKSFDELDDKYKRVLAEYDNFRKREFKQRETIYADVTANTIFSFLPVLDNLERAMPFFALEGENKKGFEQIVLQFEEILKKLNVTAIGTPGEPFDPNLHNAVMHEENEDLGQSVISEVFLKGYAMGDRVIRPATVKVAN